MPSASEPARPRRPRMGVDASELWQEIRAGRNESRALIGAVAAAGLVLMGFAWQTVSGRMEQMVNAAESVALDVRRVVDKTDSIGRDSATTAARVEALRDDIQRIDDQRQRERVEDSRGGKR